MMKFYYRLLTKGKQSAYRCALNGQVFPLPKGKEWNVAYPSKEKYVMARDEETARHEMRSKLKSKWTGFVITRREQV